MSISFPENVFERKFLVPDLSMSSLLICKLNMGSLQFADAFETRGGAGVRVRVLQWWMENIL